MLERRRGVQRRGEGDSPRDVCTLLLFSLSLDLCLCVCVGVSSSHSPSFAPPSLSLPADVATGGSIETAAGWCVGGEDRGRHA